ncbi:heavy-metal-associated domain-containing protein [Marinifilum fragile]|uniref:heavy-metal-associated domain-containing protein n=1 Tax=Marinifilum fragile TaxID=570161 RepID=UPI0006D2B53C|nr:cation transporter [Marinifilum fragile]
MAYLLSIISGAIVFGLLIDNFLPREWFAFGGLHHHMTGHEGHWELPNWLKWGSSISLSLLIINGYLQKYLSSKKEVKTKDVEVQKEEKLVMVYGMSCNHCKNSVEKHIGALQNIDVAEVNLEQKILRMVGTSINLSQIKKEIESLGFEFDENVKN